MIEFNTLNRMSWIESRRFCTECNHWERKMTNSTRTRRQFLAEAGAVGGIAAAGGSLISVAPAASMSMAKVGMQLGWLASYGILGEVVAAHQG